MGQWEFLSLTLTGVHRGAILNADDTVPLGIWGTQGHPSQGRDSQGMSSDSATPGFMPHWPKTQKSSDKIYARKESLNQDKLSCISSFPVQSASETDLSHPRALFNMKYGPNHQQGILNEHGCILPGQIGSPRLYLKVFCFSFLDIEYNPRTNNKYVFKILGKQSLLDFSLW